jgi:hypothetical protein
MPEDTVTPAKRRGRPPKQTAEVTVMPVRQICQWCATEVLRGQSPAIWVTCAECQAKEAAYLAQPACPSCGARPGVSVAGVEVRDGHRDNCLTRATAPLGRRSA